MDQADLSELIKRLEETGMLKPSGMFKPRGIGETHWLNMRLESPWGIVLPKTFHGFVIGENKEDLARLWIKQTFTTRSS